MTRLNIKIKDSEKAIIIINLLKELPFVEIEESEDDTNIRPVRKQKENLEELFGVWQNRKISTVDIRKKAWVRNDDSL